MLSVPGYAVRVDEDGGGLGDTPASGNGARFGVIRQEVPFDGAGGESRRDPKGCRAG